jgi:hypothetical protein
MGYPTKAPGWLERWSCFTVLRVLCHRVGRAETIGTPWLWKLKAPQCGERFRTPSWKMQEN